MDKTKVGSITLPFLPMQPKTGIELTRENLSSTLKLLSGYVIQLKLNGNRAYLALVKKKARLYDRNGLRISGNVSEVSPYLKLPDGTIFDGEIYKDVFYPCELLSFGNESFTRETVDDRIAGAEEVLKSLKLAYVFGTPSIAWVEQLHLNLPMWEGIIAKKRGSPYIFMNSASQKSDLWFLCRWRTV